MKLPFQPFDKSADFTQTRRRLPHRTQPGCTYFLTWRLADSVPREVLERWKQERGEFYRLHPQPWDTCIQRVYDDRFPRRMEHWADAGHGACHLREPHLRQMVVDAFHHFDAQRYDLDSYVVMPNHVHVLVTPRVGSENKSDAGLQLATQCDAELQSATQSDAGLQPATQDDKAPREMVSSDEGQTKALPHTEGQTKALPHTERSWSLSWIMKHWKGATSFQINKALGRSGSLWMDESFDHAVRSELQFDRFRRYIRENPAKARLEEGAFSLWERQSDAGLQPATQCDAELQSAPQSVAGLQPASLDVALESQGPISRKTRPLPSVSLSCKTTEQSNRASPMKTSVFPRPSVKQSFSLLHFTPLHKTPGRLKLCLTLLLLLTALTAHAASPPVVSNVQASQGSGTKLVDIYYDVSDADGGAQSIQVQISGDAGLTYTIPCVTLSGHVGSGINVGTNKHIVWNAGADWNGQFVQSTKVRVTASDGTFPAPPPGMVLIPAGTFQIGKILMRQVPPRCRCIMSK